MLSKIWLSKPHLTENELDFVKEAFSSNWITTLGNNINKFEDEVCNYLGVSNIAVALNSGTSALHLALEDLNIGQNDEVICSTFTFCASANPIKYQKARPIFVDCELDTWNMSPYFLEKAIKNRIDKKKIPKAIIVVDSYGMPAKWDEIKEVSLKYEIPIIEDSAAAFGSSYKNINCGLFGDYGVFSFNGNKIITTSSGGILLLNNNQNRNALILKASQSKINNSNYLYNEVGYNYRMSNVLAGIGRAQLKKIENRIESRRGVNQLYYKELNSDNIQFLKEPTEDFYSNHWLSCLYMKENKDNIDDVIKLFEKANIEIRRLWKPLHTESIYKGSLYFGENVSTNLYNKGFCLPSSSNLEISDQKKIIEIIKKHLT